MKRVVIIPTYDEVKNIKALLSRIHAVLPDAYIVVVDDSSPDGTGEVVREYAKTNARVSLLSRGQKGGLGQAYLYAFEKVLADPDVGAIAMMDADFSHDPDYLPEMFEALKEADVVVGSRYVSGGGIVGWELWRRLLSFFGNMYCKVILRMSIFDVTGGFYCMKVDVLREADVSSIDVSGYAFQIELKYLLWKQGARLKEFPVIFKNRIGGESKITNHIIGEGVLAPWRMLFKKK